MTSVEAIRDDEFQESTVVEVERYDGSLDTYSVKMSDGWSITVVSPDMAPKPGMTIRTYGRGLGYEVRGIALDGHVIRYESQEQMEARFVQEQAAALDESQRKLESERADRDARRSALPDVFQRRLLRFQGNNPDWRRDYESYELFVCEQAVKIAQTLGTVEAVNAFRAASWDEQLKLVPGLSDDHSGNTFGCACLLAQVSLSEEPENVVRIHGSLSPLVGSDAYGDVPRPSDQLPSAPVAGGGKG